MPKEEKVICVGCPLGCEVELTLDDKGKVTEVKGNQCKEGESYAIEEYKNPVRVLCGTVLTQGSSRALLAIRSKTPILKTKLVGGNKALAKVRAKPPVKMGDVIMSNLVGTGVDVVATSDLPD